MDADRWIDRVTSQRNHLPEMAELATLEEELRELIKAMKEAQTAQAPLRAAYEDAKNEADRLSHRAEDLEKTLATSTAGARELSAIQTELDHLHELLGKVEDRELQYLLELEPIEETLDAIKRRAQPQIERRLELQDIIVELQATLDEELVSLRALRGERAAALAPALLARYDAAFVRAGTSGAANVDAGRCDGCRIALAPLDHDRWKVQSAETFMACPECGRLLLP